jgi:lantibiotic modifying enzyme
MALAVRDPRAETWFLDGAREIAARLIREAVWCDDRCSWLGDDVVDDGEVVHRSLAGDLYGGTSGVAWFLANVWSACGDEEAAVAAAGALRQSLRRSGEAPGAGLYTGQAGIALAGVTAGRLLGDAEIVGAAAELAADVASDGDATSGGVDLIGGLAGTILALLELAESLENTAMRDVAGSLGRRLLECAKQTETGWAWVPDQHEPPLCGLGHGASGIAIALVELAAAFDDPDFMEGAAGALLYERSWFSRARGGWPDLREFDRDRLDAGEEPPYLPYWCHGGAGIGVARLRAFRRTRDRSLLAEAAAAVDGATAAMLRTVIGEDGRPRGADLSLCHGVGSVAELHVVAAEITGDAEHLEHARRLVRLALFGSEPADGHAMPAPPLPGELRCGVPGGGETPGLMLGLAGIGALLLRLHDPGLLPSPLLVSGWASAARRQTSEGSDLRVAPDLHDPRVALQLADHDVV